MSNPFNSPSSGEKIINEDTLGRLMLITPLSVEHDITTVHGITDALRADIVVLDEKGGDHQVHSDTRIFQRVLISTLKGSIGKEMPVLGVLAKGEKKAGKDAPWIIAPPDAKQIALALKYWNESKPVNPFE